jgi:hypothetical protein
MGPIPIKPVPRALQGIEISTIFFNKKISSDTQWVPIEYPPCITENKVNISTGHFKKCNTHLHEPYVFQNGPRHIK